MASCKFFYGRSRACVINQCVKIYWMFFLVPITFLDSRLIYLISARVEHRLYLMLKIVWILTVCVLPMRLVQGLIELKQIISFITILNFSLKNKFVRLFWSIFNIHLSKFDYLIIYYCLVCHKKNLFSVKLLKNIFKVLLKLITWLEHSILFDFLDTTSPHFVSE